MLGFFSLIIRTLEILCFCRLGQDLTMTELDPVSVCIHAHFISGCEWIPRHAIFTRKLAFTFWWKDEKTHFL